MKRGFFKRALAVVLCLALLDFSNLTSLATNEIAAGQEGETTISQGDVIISTGDVTVSPGDVAESQEETTVSPGDVTTIAGEGYKEKKSLAFRQSSVSGNNLQQTIELTICHYLGNEVEDNDRNMLFAPDSLTIKSGDSVQIARKEECYSVTGATLNGEEVNVAEDGSITVKTIGAAAVIHVFYEKTEGTYTNDTSMFDYDAGKQYDQIPDADDEESINYSGNYDEKWAYHQRIGTIEAHDDYPLIVEQVADDGSKRKVNANAFYRSESGDDFQLSWYYANKYPIIQGLLAGLEKSEGSDVYDQVKFNYGDPGFFSEEIKCGKHILDGYSLEFGRTGMEYELEKVWKDETIVCDNLSQFFPLGGNNFYFGLRYDFTFTIDDYIGDMIYGFVGDDDLWVCLDGEVILDLGGIHAAYPSQNTKVDYAPGEVDLWSVLLEKEDYTVQDKISYVSNPENADREHTVTVLFMERGANQSNCNMKFVMPNVVATPPVVTSEDSPQQNPESKLTQKKTAELVQWDNRTYKINLEAASQLQQVTEAEPIDIALAIDVSRSMLYPAVLDHVGEKKVSELNKNEYYYYIQDPGGWNAVFVLWHVNGRWYRMDTSSWDYSTNARGNAQNATSVKNTETYDVYTSAEYTADLQTTGNTENEHDRMHAMKTAVKGFVNSIAEASPESRIGIVTFGGRGSKSSADPACNRQVEGLTTLNTAGVHTLEQDIDAIEVSANGNTYQQKGLDLANTLIQSGTADKDNRYVVFITDGAPNFTVGSGYSSMAEEVTAYAEKVKQNAVLMTLGVGIDDVVSAKTLMTDIASRNDDNKPYAYNVTSAADMENMLQIVGNDILSLVPITGVTIVDSIDGHFDVTDAEGNLLEEGSEITDSCGNSGILRKNAAGCWYVEWNDLTIANSVNGTTGWAAEIYVKAKKEFLGGNMIPTNGPDSGIYVNQTFIPFDRPTVNVKLSEISLGMREVTLFKGEEITPAEYMKEISETLQNEYGFTYPALQDAQIAKLVKDKSLTVDYNYAGEKNGSFTYTLESANEWADHQAVKVGEKVEVYQMQVIYRAENLETRKLCLVGYDVPNTEEGTESFDGVEVSLASTKTQEGCYWVNVVSGSLTVIKAIDPEKLDPEQGDPVFSFRVSKDGEFFCYQTVRFDGDEKEKVVMKLSDLEKGIYIVEELATLRYEQEASIAEGLGANPASVEDKNAAVFGIGRTQRDEKTVLGARDGKVTFTNGKVNHHNFSHTDVVVNHFVIGEDGKIRWTADTLQKNEERGEQNS